LRAEELGEGRWEETKSDDTREGDWLFGKGGGLGGGKKPRYHQGGGGEGYKKRRADKKRPKSCNSSILYHISAKVGGEEKKVK